MNRYKLHEAKPLRPDQFVIEKGLRLRFNIKGENWSATMNGRGRSVLPQSKLVIYDPCHDLQGWWHTSDGSAPEVHIREFYEPI